MNQKARDAARKRPSAPTEENPDTYQGTLGMLLLIASRQVASCIRPAFESGGLKPRHVELMAVLARHESTSQQYLAEALRVDPSIVVGLLNELERDGMVRRVRDPRDRRRHLVEISEQGIAGLRHGMADIEAAEAAAFAALDEDEKRTLRRLLSAIQAHTAGEVC
ncbi:MarR family winged helix-turn-helix transcriptional regulator [Streptomyces sp. NPDC059894]|uniref:MarR family winged helix-turn-helix transcriptional regulator n=1 Tax=unclassified Streptomyces TaxID=2593676 RepID=UPI00364A7886